jgi:hypothetical protein
MKLIEKLKIDFPFFCEHCLKIKTKDATLEPFVLNEAQQYFYKKLKEQLTKKGKVRLVIVKGRQQGLSTVIQALYFWKTIFTPNINTFILTHEAEATKNLFTMTKRYYDNFPYEISTKEDSANSLYFEGLESGYKVGTAGNKSVGRSQTIQLFHGSEVAFWQHADMHGAGIMQTIPNSDNTYIIFESTACGIGNFFYDKYKESLTKDSDFDLVFVPWYWQKEYKREMTEDFILTEEEKQLKKVYGITDEQIAWRRYKIRELNTTGVKGEDKFKEEYPMNPDEAFIATNFNAYLDVNLIKDAMEKEEHVEPYGARIMGVDPSGSGKDKTGFCIRKGRVVEKIFDLNTQDEMEVVGLVMKYINDYRIDFVFVDSIGIGSGIISRLKELEHSEKIMRVNSSENALNRNDYSNLRAEMWSKCREWLEDTPCKIPNDPELLNQMVSVGYKADSKNRLLMEKKEDIKKEGRPSPDKADALMYTFARPVSLVDNKPIPVIKRI